MKEEYRLNLVICTELFASAMRRITLLEAEMAVSRRAILFPDDPYERPVVNGFAPVIRQGPLLGDLVGNRK